MMDGKLNSKLDSKVAVKLEELRWTPSSESFSGISEAIALCPALASG